MEKKRTVKAKFLCSVIDPKKLPEFRDSRGSFLDEVALLGRSNVGKSSLINHLFQNQTLAKVSSKPGKTRLGNFFLVDDKTIFVDLPGYGYAKAAKHLKEEWSGFVDSYLKTRKSLKLFLFLLDIRRDPSELDQKLFEWALFSKIPFLCVLTKADQVKQQEKNSQIEKIFSQFQVQEQGKISFVLHSVYDARSREEVLDKIDLLLGRKKWEL